MTEIKLIAAVDDRLGIAKKQKIPWKIPTDKAYFRQKLDTGPVVMGLNTYISNGRRPYGPHKNTVFTKNKEHLAGVETNQNAVAFFENLQEDIWVAGGGQIFEIALPFATELYITRVQGEYDCDVFFPKFEDNFMLKNKGPWQTENGYNFRFEVWIPKAG